MDQHTARDTYSARKVFFRLLGLGKPYVRWYVGLCIITLVSSALGVLSTEAIRRMINGATDANHDLLRSSFYLGMIVVVVQAVINIVSSYFGGMLDFHSVMDLQSKLLRKLTRVEFGQLQKYHTGDLITRITDSAGSAQGAVNSKSRELFGLVLTIIFTLSYLSFLNFELTAGSLLIALLLPLMLNPLSTYMRRNQDEQLKHKANIDAFVQDSVQGAEVVRAFSLSAKLNREFQIRYDAFLKFARKTLRWELAIDQSRFLVNTGGMIFILGYGGYQVVRGSLDLGGVVAFLVSYQRIAHPVTRLAKMWPDFQQSISHANRMFELFDLKEEISPVAETMQNPDSFQKIGLVFHEVRFSYKKNREVLQGTTFTVDPGKVTALVGRSGCGKSTLLKLVLRYHVPDSGIIYCNGQNIGEIPLATWRACIAYVPQEPYLFSGTLHENLLFGKPDATFEEVVSACRDANIHEVIQKLPHQYETRLGERGFRLSGGERQRLAIARALIKNPKLLILDEPTSALDSENEHAVQQALSRLMKNRTTLIVAHRLSTIQNADKIVVIDHGVVMESGTHAQLMEKSGKYHDLHKKIELLRDLATHSKISRNLQSQEVA